ncbi:MAG: HD-GYP domain-containing protein [Firmicutes bacterium]|nr:HD-GYP domain-containing protein [Bacillota bacterium]
MRKMRICRLRPGMILAKAIYGPDGQLLLNKGVELKGMYIAGLQRMDIQYVYVYDPLMEDVEEVQVVSDVTKHQTIKVMKKTFGCLKANGLEYGQLMNRRFLNTVEKLIDEVLANKDIVYNLDNIRYTDDYTFTHSVNVCILSLLVASGLQLSRNNLKEMAVGALLHDVGKLWVDENILKKEGSLTPAEFEQIKRHPLFGYDILSEQANIAPTSIKIALQHHERCDGSGYPYQLVKKEIHQYSRLVMIVDVFDALTADRPYRKALPPHKAVEIILSFKGAYDTEMIRLFLDHIAVYPLGTALRLNNGDLGLVVKNKKGRPFQPVVRICKNKNGRFYASPFDIDLAETKNLFITEILSEKERDRELPLDI